MIEHILIILVTGPDAAGKTPLIQSVSQTQVVCTDVATSGAEADVKAHTTVVMDCGTSSVDDDVRRLLLGAPGQSRFRFMTDILKSVRDTVAFVIDAEADGTHAAAGVELRSMLADLEVPTVIAVNRCDDLEVAQRIARSIGASPDHSVVPCQLNEPVSGREFLVEVLVSLLTHIETSRACHERTSVEVIRLRPSTLPSTLGHRCQRSKQQVCSLDGLFSRVLVTNASPARLCSAHSPKLRSTSTAESLTTLSLRATRRCPSNSLRQASSCQHRLNEAPSVSATWTISAAVSTVTVPSNVIR
jgi:signal recognition particle receptor subunit beta